MNPNEVPQKKFLFGILSARNLYILKKGSGYHWVLCLELVTGELNWTGGCATGGPLLRSLQAF
jgi:hypothetical protein